MIKRRWSPEDDAWLREHWSQTSREVISATLGRSAWSVQVRASILGLSKQQEQRTWSRCEDDYLREHYKIQTYDAIGSHVGHSAGAVKERVRALGLRKYRKHEASPAPE